jgi:phosphoribosylformylglycinamidine synthase
MLGIVDDKKHITSLSFKNEGDAIVMIGRSRNDINSSEYVYSYHGIKNTPAPDFDLDEEYNVQVAIREIIRAGAVHSAHDCADGGLFITLLESGMQHQLGFDITSAENVRKDAFLFGEAQSRVIVSCAANNTEVIKTIAEKHGVAFNVLGTVKGNACVVDGKNFGTVTEYTNSYNIKLETIMNN